ncbi:MAG: tRNA (guanosine(37)-N1)-methyltransferase TrmD [Acetobacteraceae bacterium]|nr:tRNA (guanosine(37)-N1)-methyltransferase TrmD [Acetobacteraceae bacterium]
MFPGPLNASILGRAQAAGLLTVNIVNLRDFTHDRHRTTDDYPYGGGQGMVMKPEPVFEALDALLPPQGPPPGTRVILTSPQGETFTQSRAWELSRAERLVLICGRYEGVDERVRHRVTDEISIGDYVLTGGELAALVILDAVARLIPGVLGSGTSPLEESFSCDGLLEGPQYTRPPEYRGLAVPEVLLSGDHARIRQWRRRQALARTLERRPDLLERARLGPEDRRYLEGLRAKGGGPGEG